LNEKVKLQNTKYIENRDNIQSSLKIYNELPETIAGLNKNASIINTDAKILLTKVEVAQEDLDDLAGSNTSRYIFIHKVFDFHFYVFIKSKQLSKELPKNK
jgi:hypothetical protein